MMRFPFHFKRLTLCAQIIAGFALSPMQGASAASGAGTTSGDGGTIVATKLPDFFHVPIWGLRVGGADTVRPPANDSWEYFRAGRGIMKVSPSAIDYGTLEVGESKLADAITIQNIGAAPIRVGTVAAPHQYTASNECDNVLLPPLGSCIYTIQIRTEDVRSATGFVQMPFSAEDGASAIANITVTATVKKPASGGPGLDLGGGGGGSGSGSGSGGSGGTGESGSGSGGGSDLTTGPDGELALVFPPPIYLGDAPHSRSFELASRGEKPLSIKSLSITEGSYFYSPTHDCPTELPVGQSCRVTVKLNPLAAGSLTGKLVVHTSSFDATKVNVRLLADVDEWVRRISFAPTLDWGVVDRGYARTQSLTVTNTGNLPASGIKVTAPSPYSVSASTCTGTLEPTKSCVVTFSFSSSTDGLFTRQATITATNLMQEPPPVELKAEVSLRQGTFSPASFAFGLKDMAKLSSALPLYFTNTGTRAVKPYFGVLSDPSTTDGAYGTAFKRLNGSAWTFLNPGNCEAEIAIGGTCTAYLAVQPTSTGAQSMSFTAYPHEGMSVRGTGLSVTTTGTKQSFVYNPTLLDMGVVDGVHTVEGTIDITNTSLDNTTLTGFQTAVAQPTQNRGTITTTGTTCVSSLSAAQKTCQIKVQLTGKSLAKDDIQESKDGSVNFYYTGADTKWTVVPVNFLLRGNAPSITTDGLDFGGIPVGQASQNAPRRLVTVTNPGPSNLAISSVAFPGTTSYGLSLTRDTAYPNSCVLNQAIAPGKSCVIALYPSSGPNSNWGEVTTSVQLYTIINGNTVPLGEAFPARANHLTPSFEFEDLTVAGGENTASTFTAPFRLKYAGSITTWGNMSATSGGMSAYTTNCSGQLITEASACTLTFNVTAKQGSADRVLRAPLLINRAGLPVELGAITATVTQEPASATITPTTWDFGNKPALLNTADSADYAKSFVLKNTSTRATILLQSTAYATSWLQRLSGTRVVDGESLPDCSTSLAPGAKCAVTLALAPVVGNQSLLGPQTSDLTLNLGNEAGSLTVPVSTNFLPGKLEITQAPAEFVDIPAATTSTWRAIRLKNTGEGVVRWAGIPNAGGEFAIENNGPQLAFKLAASKAIGTTSYVTVTGSQLKPANTAPELTCEGYRGLQPGAECSMLVVMSPSGTSTNYLGTFKVGGYSPVALNTSLELKGNSVAAEVYYSSQAFNFPADMQVGTEYRAQIIVGNGGNYPLNLSSIRMPSPSYPTEELALEHNCPPQLAAGDECVLELTLTPDRNRNWSSTVSPVQSVALTETTQGVSRVKTFYLAGVSTGAFVTATPQTSANLLFELADFPSQDLYEVTLTASGTAPVRLLSETTTHGGTFLTDSGTCVPGRTLQPGGSCTLKVKTSATLSALPYGSFSRSFLPLSINGSHVDNKGSLIVDRSVRLSVVGSGYSSQAGVSMWPRTVPADRSSKIYAVNSNMVANSKISLDGIESVIAQPTTISHANASGPISTKIAEITAQASGVAVAKVITYQGPPVSNSYTRVVSTKKFNLLLPGESNAPVYSTARTPPMLLSGTTIASVPLTSGGAVTLAYIGTTLFAVATDEYGLPKYSVSLGDFGGIVSGGSSFNIGANGKIYITFSTVMPLENKTCINYYYPYCYEYSYSYAKQGNLVLVELGVNGTAFTSTSVSAKATNHTGYSSSAGQVYGPVSTASGLNDYLWWAGVASTGAPNFTLQGVIAGRSYSAGMNSYLNGLPHAIAIVDDYAFVRQNDSIYAFKSSGGAPVRYDFPNPGFGNTVGSSMVHNKKAGTLTLPCYNSAALCSIPVSNGALGTLSVEIGNTSAQGADDGNASSATLSILNNRIGSLNADGSVIGFTNSATPSHTRAVNLSTIPVYGGVGAQNHIFTIQLDEEGSALPHVITLKNQGAIPLNVLSLSDSSVQYTTDCTNVAYQGTCSVTVQVPHTLWTAAPNGSFKIRTSTGVDITANWTAPAA